MNSTPEFQEQIGRIEGLVAKLDAADPATRITSRELVQCIMDLHSAALERVMEVLAEANASPAMIDSLAHDPLVSSLLVLYNLHPEDFEMRARRGLEKIRPLLRSRDVRMDSVEIDGEAIHIRLSGPVTHELIAAMREALLETAPDASEVDIEGKFAQASQGFVPLASLMTSTVKPEPVGV